MPRIDPNQLLKCLGILLGSNGGIRSSLEVKRISTLMSKFSKKLVSKCIYIQILKSSQTTLLVQFMAEGGWALVFQWLDDGIITNNYPLIQEILELLLLCPISLDRLKENNCPKVIKGLSKDSEDERVRTLAGKLVEQWLKFIKSGQAAISQPSSEMVGLPAKQKNHIAPSDVQKNTVPLQRFCVKDSSTIIIKPSTSGTVLLSSSKTGVNKIKNSIISTKSRVKQNKYVVRQKFASDSSDDEVEEETEGVEEEEEEEDGDSSSTEVLPTYKITVRDGKNVLAKIGGKSSIESEVSSESSSSLSKSEISSSKPETTTTIPKSVADSQKHFRDTLQKAIASKLGHKPVGVKLEREKKEKISSEKEKSVVEKELPTADVLKTEEATKDRKLKEKEKNTHKSNSSSSSSSSREKHKEKIKSDSRDKSRTKDSSKDKDKERHKSREKEKAREKERSSSSKSKSSDKVSSSDRIEKVSSSEKSDKLSVSDKSSSNKTEKTSNVDKTEKVSSSDKTEKLNESESLSTQSKDKDTLDRIKPPPISSLGKIPKKPSATNLIVKSNDPKVTDLKKNNDSSVTEKKNTDVKKLDSDPKKIDPKKPRERPKTVKTFNSKFRSTGLEEEIKPPPSRASLNKKPISATVEKKLPLPVKIPSAVKHPSSAPKEDIPPEKKSKIAEIDTKKDTDNLDKPGGIKLTSTKPKPLLQESDMFSDALTASIKMEPRRRKRRTSNSKDGPEAKKETKDEALSEGDNSPKEVKPAFKFYRDTLEDDEKKKAESDENVPTTKGDKIVDSTSNVKEEITDEDVKEGVERDKKYPNGVLVYHKIRKGPKKSIKWKPDSELISIQYFELDETERVNVTRTFVDMKQMERSHERESFLLARKLSTDDNMEEKIPYGLLHIIDIPEGTPIVEPGKNSMEKGVQYAREKTVLQALYFQRHLIPDSPQEPDPEFHPTTDPKIIPLDDITGNKDSIASFTHLPWPEPKPNIIPSSPPPQNNAPQPNFAGFSGVGNFGPFPGPMGIPGLMPPIVPPQAGPGPGPGPGSAPGTWRAPDGTDMPMPMNFHQPGQMGNMGPGPNMFPMQGPPPDGFNVGGFNPGFPMGGDPNMFQGPPGPMGGGPMPPWNRNWQGPRGPGPNNFMKGVCHKFARFGNCSRGNSCRFMHPGVNCPPLS